MACCGLTKLVCCLLSMFSTLVIAVVITIAVLFILRRTEYIDTEERNETDAGALTTALTLLKTAVFSSNDGSLAGTLSLVGGFNSTIVSLLAVNGLSFASDCEGLEVRLLGTSSTSSNPKGLLVVPVTADLNVTADFSETIYADSEAALYDQVALWCTTSSGTEEQLGDTADLETPTTLEGGSTIIRQATLSGSDYTAEGLVQIIGSVAIVNDILVTTYYLRLEDIDVSSGPDVYMYLTTDEDEPEDVDAEGSLRVYVEGAERGTFSFTGTYSQAVPDGFMSPEEYVAAVVWCDEFDVLFGSGLFVDV